MRFSSSDVLSPEQDPSHQAQVAEAGPSTTATGDPAPGVQHTYPGTTETFHQRPTELASSPTRAARPTSRLKRRCRRAKLPRSSSFPDVEIGILTANNSRVQSPRTCAAHSSPLPPAKENQPLLVNCLDTSKSTAGFKPKSRPKVRCKFGPPKQGTLWTSPAAARNLFNLSRRMLFQMKLNWTPSFWKLTRYALKQARRALSSILTVLPLIIKRMGGMYLLLASIFFQPVSSPE